MKKKSILLAIIFILLLLSNCKLNDSMFCEIKKKYSAEVINYFYELAFEDSLSARYGIGIRKWDKDIRFYIEGDTLLGDTRKVYSSVNELNSYGLPIKIYETKNRKTANLILSFEPQNNSLSALKAFGFAQTDATNGHIQSVLIKIFHNRLATSIPDQARGGTIFHELFHSLGLPGHSYCYFNGRLYPNTSFPVQTIPIDIQVVKLLYEPEITYDYKCKKFEHDFSDVLYNIDSKRKFLSFVKEQHITKNTLEFISQYGLFKPSGNKREERVVKSGIPTSIILKGEYPKSVIDIMKKTIYEMNTAIGRELLFFVKNDSLVYDVGIRYSFKKDTLINDFIVLKSSTTVFFDLFFPGRIKSNIEILYKLPLNENEMKKVISSSIFLCFCLNHFNQPIFFTFNNKGIQLKPEFKEILKVYYSTELPNGFKKSELEEVIRKMK